MSPSSASIPSPPLPFGADTHTHASWRRSTSAHRSKHHGPQTYNSFIASAQAYAAASRASIPPTSITNLPPSYKKLLRRHSILLWTVAVIFELSTVGFTVAIVLAVVNAHKQGAGGETTAIVIVGVLSFAGLVGSAAVGWLIWRGRKERARLERGWEFVEQEKERRSVCEKAKEEETMRSIQERARNLSQSRSRSRGRGLSRAPPIPTLTSMAPTPAPHQPQPSQNPRGSTWTHHLDLSPSSSSSTVSEASRFRKASIARLEQKILTRVSGPTNPTPNPNTSPTLINSGSSPTQNAIIRTATTFLPAHTPTLRLHTRTLSSNSTPAYPEQAIIRPSNPISSQSDENFMEMIEIAADAASEDEDVRAARRERSREQVEAWRFRDDSLDLDDEGEYGGNREGKGRRWFGGLGRRVGSVVRRRSMRGGR